MKKFLGRDGTSKEVSDGVFGIVTKILDEKSLKYGVEYDEPKAKKAISYIELKPKQGRDYKAGGFKNELEMQAGAAIAGTMQSSNRITKMHAVVSGIIEEVTKDKGKSETYKRLTGIEKKPAKQALEEMGYEPKIRTYLEKNFKIIANSNKAAAQT